MMMEEQLKRKRFNQAVSFCHQYKESSRRKGCCVYGCSSTLATSFLPGWRSAIFPTPPTDRGLLEKLSSYWELSAAERLCISFISTAPSSIMDTSVTAFVHVTLQLRAERDLLHIRNCSR